jgi:hypothetical protein
MKMHPNEVKVNSGSNASSKISSLFAENIELQFPIEKPDQVISLRTAQNFSNEFNGTHKSSHKGSKVANRQNYITIHTRTTYSGSKSFIESYRLEHCLNWQLSGL